jgi:hypothetical protein
MSRRWCKGLPPVKPPMRRIDKREIVNVSGRAQTVVLLVWIFEAQLLDDIFRAGCRITRAAMDRTPAEKIINIDGAPHSRLDGRAASRTLRQISTIRRNYHAVPWHPGTAP